MRILITGGAGFIGSHLSDELLARGHHVSVLDDLSTGAIDNIRHLKHHPRFEYAVGSCHERRLVAEMVDSADIVYHLAAAVGVELIVESPVRTIETNIHAAEVVLNAASKKKKPVFVASTSEVYGKSTAIPFQEDGDLVLGPTFKGRWSYACSKAIDEFLALAYWKERGLPTVIGRMFNTVGPRQTGRYGMVVPNLVGQAIAGKPLTVFGDGTQSRCFCHVHDVVRALADMMEREDLYGEIFNIGTEAEITITGLAEKVVEVVGSTSNITYVPYDVAYEPGFEDMHRRVPDITKIHDVLAWEPRKSLDEIVVDVKHHMLGETDRLALAA
jgi:nucleoside-diphosphate-sugar epimerase